MGNTFNLAFVLTATITLMAYLLEACVYVPPVWDAGDEIYKIDEIEEGVTTKAEVLELFGEPEVEGKNSNNTYYKGKSSGGLIIISLYPYGMAGLIDEQPWQLEIRFDENDIVVSKKIATTDIEIKRQRDEDLAERIERTRKTCVLPYSKAIKFSREKIEDLYFRCSDRQEIDHQVRLMWSCLAAHWNSASAQNAMGYHYRSHVREFDDYLVQAYKWYSLANKSGYSFTHNRDFVASKMTTLQLSDANKMVVDWQPNPVECEAFLEESSVSTQAD